MADIAKMPSEGDATPGKKVKSRKALKDRKLSSSEANIMAGSVSAASRVGGFPEKENHESLCPKNSKKGEKNQSDESSSFLKEFLEMQEMLQEFQIEKEQADELLKAKEEMLIQKEKEQEKLQMEIKKLQKTKEFFKPNLGEQHKHQEKKKEKKGKMKAAVTSDVESEQREQEAARLVEEEQKTGAISDEEAKEVRRSTRIRKPVYWMTGEYVVYK